MSLCSKRRRNRLVFFRLRGSNYSHLFCFIIRANDEIVLAFSNRINGNSSESLIGRENATWCPNSFSPSETCSVYRTFPLGSFFTPVNPITSSKIDIWSANSILSKIDVALCLSYLKIAETEPGISTWGPRRHSIRSEYFPNSVGGFALVLNQAKVNIISCFLYRFSSAFKPIFSFPSPG